jgi:hypothetical protein
MDRSSRTTLRITTPGRRRLREAVRAAAAALLTLAAVLAAAAEAPARPEPTLSAADKACMACHVAKGATMKLANGDKLALTIDGAAFARSVHRAIGCSGCHAQVSLTDHPDNVKPAESARQYTQAQTETCRECHEKTFKAHEASLHAVKRNEGNLGSPTCGGCHRPHQVSRASSADGPDRACLACHGDPAAEHAAWLPNAAKHLDAIACSACHAPDALRQVDLRLYRDGQPLVDSDATQFAQRARAADRNRDGLDAGEFRALLAELGRDGAKVAVRGHMELRDPTDAHRLAAKPTALKECVDCHSEAASPFAKVTVSVLDANGRAVRYDAHKNVLSAASTADELRAFYAIGGTRIAMLDVLLALALAGGIAVPALHLLIRRVVRRKDRGQP